MLRHKISSALTCLFPALLFGAGNLQAQRGVDPPGSLQFRSPTASVTEAATTVSFLVDRIGGDDGAVSVSYSTADGSAVAGLDYQQTSGVLQWPDNDDDPRSIQVTVFDDEVAEGSETVLLMLSNPTGGAGLGTSSATLTIFDDGDGGAAAGSIQLISNSFSINEGAPATLRVTRTGGSSGAVGVSYQTGDGSALAGSDYEVTAGSLQWPDGDTADRFITVPTVQDSLDEGNENFQITMSGPTGGATLGSPASATVQINDDDGQPSLCTANATTLCLNGGRFEVAVDFRPPGGSTTPASSFEIGQPDSGLFYFFDATNIELLVKVLDGCSINGRYWVFFAATTDVQFTVTVTDTSTGTIRTYTNPQGQAADAVTDTSAFATCP